MEKKEWKTHYFIIFALNNRDLSPDAIKIHLIISKLTN